MLKKRIIIILIVLIVLLIGAITSMKYVEKKYSQALISAIEANDLDELSRLCKKHISKNAKPHFLEFDRVNRQPLTVACYKGNFEAVKILVESGAKLDVVGTNGDTPLLLAIGSTSENRYDIIYYLIEKGADINKKRYNNIGNAAIAELILADSKTPKHYELFQYMIEKGADIYKSSQRGCILFEACEANDIEIVRYLFENYNLDVNMQSSKGPYKKVYNESLLMMTAYRDASEVCEYLIEKGIDKNLKDSEGKTAYDWAIKYNASKVLELLN